MTVETQRVIFTIEKKTKNTIRYSEQANGKPPAIGSLYVQQWLLGTNPPERLAITIEETQQRLAAATAPPEPRE